jgi:hypothetical protein
VLSRQSYSRPVTRDSPIDLDSIREAIRKCSGVGSNSWVVGVSLATQDGQEIKGDAVYLAGPDTAVLVTKNGAIEVAVSEIANVYSHLRSPGAE